jgi:hypothetical protein
MSDRTEPSPAELANTARSAREQLLSSLAQLEQRGKQLAYTAKNATAAGGWTVAAVCAFVVSVSLTRGPARARRVEPASTFSRVLRTAAAAVGLAATGVLIYSAQRRARALSALGHAVSSTPRLGTGNGARPPLPRPAARA